MKTVTYKWLVSKIYIGKKNYFLATVVENFAFIWINGFVNVYALRDTISIMTYYLLPLPTYTIMSMKLIVHCSYNT